MATNEVVPVTVIGGYLGAGKTTLLNHLLTSAVERLAVLVNDFGDINIDADLIESHDGETMTLANGCICCSMVDGLAAALETVLALEPQPDRLVIEASGVADPATVAGYCHAPGLLLDAVVVVVDVETVRAKVGDRYTGDMVAAQLRAADILIVNKTDLVEPTAVDAVIDWLHDFCPDGLKLPAEQAAVAPQLLFGADLTPVSEPGRSKPQPKSADEVFESWSWSSDEPLERKRLEAVMDAVPDNVWRVKGIVRLAEDDRRLWVLQRVGRRWSLRPTSAAAEGHTRSQLVAIGHRGAIEDSWLDRQLR